MSKLLNCPFCGTGDLLGFESSKEGGWIVVMCRRCGCSGPTGRSESEEEATAWWNRHAQPAPRAEALPMQPVVRAEDGVIRFKANRIVSDVLEASSLDMNALACRDYTPEERMQFAQLIGYSVSGYGDLSYVSDESYEQASAKAEAIAARSGNAPHQTGEGESK